MTQNVEDFMNYLCATIKEFNNDESILKRIFSNILFSASNIPEMQETNSNEYEWDDDIKELLIPLGLFHENEGVLPYDDADSVFEYLFNVTREDYGLSEAREWASYREWTPEKDTDYVYVNIDDKEFKSNIEWSFSLAELASTKVVTIEEINALKQKYEIDHK